MEKKNSYIQPTLKGVLINSLFVLSVVLLAMAIFPLSVHSGAGDLTFNNAQTWQILHSRGLPARPYANQTGGWYFNFPVSNPCYASDSACPVLGYVTTPYNGSIYGKKAVTMTVDIPATGNPVFNYKTEPGNTCDSPAKVTLLLQHIGDNLTLDYYRFWSTTSIELKPGGPYTITVPLTPDHWSSVYGHRGDSDQGSQAAFTDILQGLGNIGMTFGGGCFAGHGINISGGTAQFVVTNFAALAELPVVDLPTYSTNSLIDSAGANTRLAKNSWVTVYGQNLISDAACPRAYPFPNEMCGTKISVNGTNPAISYASKTQINFLMPDITGNVPFTVTNRSGMGNTIYLNVNPSNMNLYSQSGNGTGLVAAQHWNTPGLPAGTLITPTNPVNPDYAIVLYASGLGDYISDNHLKPTVFINGRALSSDLVLGAYYAGGQGQINIKKLDGKALGLQYGTNNYPIQICGGGVCGNTLGIPIKYTAAP